MVEACEITHLDHVVAACVDGRERHQCLVDLQHGGEGGRIGLSPAWMVALWVSFGTTLRTLGPALGAGWAAVLAGAVAGPVAYTGGVSFGAAQFGDDVWVSRLVVAAAWALAMPALVVLERRLR